MVTGECILFHDGRFWTALFMRHEGQSAFMARQVFGSEPSHAEFLEFLALHSHHLHYVPVNRETIDQLMLQSAREGRKAQKRKGHSQKNGDQGKAALDAYKDMMKVQRVERKHGQNRLKREELQERFQARQLKKKQKKRGH
ncbi:MAG: DUF2992 family protein [Spirochaetales bacterium]|nr:DUF2992 family protein [Spirochaetales bacterium]